MKIPSPRGLKGSFNEIHLFTNDALYLPTPGKYDIHAKILSHLQSCAYLPIYRSHRLNRALLKSSSYVQRNVRRLDDPRKRSRIPIPLVINKGEARLNEVDQKLFSLRSFISPRIRFFLHPRIFPRELLIKSSNIPWPV